jgi:hypothetical protein
MGTPNLWFSHEQLPILDDFGVPPFEIIMGQCISDWQC